MQAYFTCEDCGLIIAQKALLGLRVRRDSNGLDRFKCNRCRGEFYVDVAAYAAAKIDSQSPAYIGTIPAPMGFRGIWRKVRSLLG